MKQTKQNKKIYFLFVAGTLWRLAGSSFTSISLKLNHTSAERRSSPPTWEARRAVCFSSAITRARAHTHKCNKSVNMDPIFVFYLPEIQSLKYHKDTMNAYRPPFAPPLNQAYFLIRNKGIWSNLKKSPSCNIIRCQNHDSQLNSSISIKSMSYRQICVFYCW